ncbi:MAG: DUF1501 domain-containing protein [Rhizobiaceae bacterium]|nr:DUF1501 domain-containing protein [Rhizobiaceae bacterium]
MGLHDDHPEHDASPERRRLMQAAAEGCAESRLLMSRRALFGVTAGLYSAAFMPDFAQAAANPEARFLVVVLRGGMDGLNMVVPKLDPHYSGIRRELAIPASATLSLGSDFGLHPRLARLHAMYQAGDAAFIPAAGIPLQNRSHFDCQDNLENGLPENRSNATGWINRLLGAMPAGDPVKLRGGIEIGESPLIMSGPTPVLGWSPTGYQSASPEYRAAILDLYRTRSPQLHRTLSDGLRANDLALNSGAGTNADISGLRKAFIGAGRLLRTANGPRIAVLSIDNWDTHSDQGGLTGDFADRLREMDEALGDLKRELGGVWANTVATLVTEFGRTVRTNGDSGTDHGIATVATLVGGGVRKGIFGDWPGLAPNRLLDGDLRPTVDLRSVFKGVLRDHLGVAPSVLESAVFPGSLAARPLGGLVKVPARAAGSARAYSSTIMARQHPIAQYRLAAGRG